MTVKIQAMLGPFIRLALERTDNLEEKSSQAATANKSPSSQVVFLIGARSYDHNIFNKIPPREKRFCAPKNDVRSLHPLSMNKGVHKRESNRWKEGIIESFLPQSQPY